MNIEGYTRHPSFRDNFYLNDVTDVFRILILSMNLFFGHIIIQYILRYVSSYKLPAISLSFRFSRMVIMVFMQENNSTSLTNRSKKIFSFNIEKSVRNVSFTLRFTGHNTWVSS